MMSHFNLSEADKVKFKRTKPNSELELRFSDNKDTLSFSKKNFDTIFIYLSKISTVTERNYTNLTYPKDRTSSIRVTQPDNTIIVKTKLDALRRSNDIDFALTLSCCHMRLGEAMETTASERPQQEFSMRRDISRYEMKTPGGITFELSIVISRTYEQARLKQPGMVSYEVEVELPKDNIREYAEQAINVLIEAIMSRYNLPTRFKVKSLEEVKDDLNAVNRILGREARAFSFDFAVNPVNLKRDKIEKLDDYALTNKLDGERKILYLTQDQILVSNAQGYNESRPSSVYYIKASGQYDTLILDVEFYNGKFYVFDVLYDKQFFSDTPHQKRMNALNSLNQQLQQDNIFQKKFYYGNLQQNLIQFMDENPSKEWFDTSDGLIFTEKVGGYSNTKHYKYKFYSKMSIDFRLVKTQKDREYHLLVSSRGSEVPFKNQSLYSFIDYSNMIVECVLFQDLWFPLRVRDDKISPNSLRTADDVYADILNPILFTELVSFRPEYQEDIRIRETTFLADKFQEENSLLSKSFDAYTNALTYPISTLFGLQERSDYQQDLFRKMRDNTISPTSDRFIANHLSSMTNGAYALFSNPLEQSLLDRFLYERNVKDFMESKVGSEVSLQNYKTRFPTSFMHNLQPSKVKSSGLIEGRFSKHIVEKDDKYENYVTVERHHDGKVDRISQYSSLMPWHIEQVNKVFMFLSEFGINRIADMTAHVGIDVIHTKNLFPNATIDAYELVPEIYQALCKNVKGLKGVRTFPIDSCFDAYMNWKQDSYDLVYIDAPWGGKDYATQESITLYLQAESDKVKIPARDVNMIAAFLLKNRITRTVLIKVPENYNVSVLEKLFEYQSFNIINNERISYKLICLLPKYEPAITGSALLVWSKPYVDNYDTIFSGGQSMILVRIPTNLLIDSSIKLMSEWLFPYRGTNPTTIIDEKNLLEAAKRKGYNMIQHLDNDSVRYIYFDTSPSYPIQLIPLVPRKPIQAGQVPLVPRQPIQAGQVPVRDSFYYVRKYHNHEKLNLINLYCQNRSVLDLGSGYGGDLDKYSSARVTRLVLVEPSLENINDKDKGLTVRLQNNPIKTITTVINTVGQDTDTIFREVVKDGENRVQVVSSFFSMTFLFESRKTLRDFLTTVNDCLVEGGYFIGTMMEGHKSLEAFRGRTNIKYDKAEIVKRYSYNDPIDTGMKLHINIEGTIVKDQDEYLAFFSILQEEMERMGFVLDLYYDFHPDRFIDSSRMSQETKEFSGLNISFAFRKMPKSLPLQVDTLQVDETVEFFNLYGELNPLYRTGVIADGSCFYHSYLYSTNSLYVKQNESGRQGMVQDLREDFSEWVTIVKYMNLLPLETHSIIETNIIQQLSSEMIQEYRKHVSQEYTDNFKISYDRVNSDVKQEIDIHFGTIIEEIKDSIRNTAEWTEDSHIILFMEYKNINIYMFSSENRVPSTLFLPYYRVSRKESILILNLPNSHYESMFFGVMKGKDLYAKRVLGRMDPLLINMHQYLIKKDKGVHEIVSGKRFNVRKPRAKMDEFCWRIGENATLYSPIMEEHRVLRESKERRKVSGENDLAVIATNYIKDDCYGDFSWHIKSKEYEDSLFLEDESEETHNLRNKDNRRHRLAGIVVGKGGRGYTLLDEETKKAIDDSIEKVRQIIKKYGYKKVYYSVKKDGKFSVKTFVDVGPTVLDYIKNKIVSLAHPKDNSFFIK